MFANRIAAGRELAQRLAHLRNQPVVVLGLPRGGVPVARVVADALDAPLDVIVVRKLGVPFQPELAMGAVGEGGALVVNEDVVAMTRVTEDQFAAMEELARAVVARRARLFRGDRPPMSLQGRTAVVVDDGIATGATAKAACQVARAQGAARVVLAVPVAPPEWTRRFAGAADEYVCVETPRRLHAIGQFYRDFSQTTDAEVAEHLARTQPPSAAPEDAGRVPAGAGATAGTVAGAAEHGERAAYEGEADDPPAGDAEVTIPAGQVLLRGHLTVPEGASGVVVFAHGSGSSRYSPRNRYVAAALNAAGLGTLVFDLLTIEEAHDRANVFDIDLLAARLGAAMTWLRGDQSAAGLPIGYFGASTGAAAALSAAATQGDRVAAVVSRGGRPDLAGPRLPEVTAPTLMLVGGHDREVLELNRRAQARLRCESQLVVVPGATHLFDEPGTLEAVTEAAREWFTHHLTPASENGAHQ
jgi:predicted phosphoribosyltransferase/pimeloyl-ACP methyl ester carboxylesterase